MTYRRGIMLMAFALLLAPPAMAQIPTAPALQPSVAIEIATSDPIAADVNVDIRYTITYTAPPNAGGLAVEVSVEEPGIGWAVYPEPASHVAPAEPGIGGTYTFEGVLRVDHDGRPLAFEPRTLNVRAFAPGDGRAVQAAEAAAQTTIQAAWRPGLQVTASTSGIALRGSGGEDAVTAEVRNTGNALATVEVEILRLPEGCASPTRLPSMTLAPGARENLRIQIECERDWAPGTLQARLTHALAADSRMQGTPVEPVWDVIEGAPGSYSGPGRTFGDESPAPRNDASWGATLLVPMALLVAALVIRRR